MRKVRLLLSLVILLSLAARPGAAAPPRPAAGKIEPALRAQLAAGRADLVVRFTAQADLAPAGALDWAARGRFVLAALKETAARSQARAQEYLAGRGLKYRPFLAGNELYVWAGDLAAAQELAGLPEVASLHAPVTYAADGAPARDTPAIPAEDPGVTGLSWGVVDTGADRFWAAFGRQGDGIVVANVSSGVRWEHPALVRSYRCPANPTDPRCWYDPTGLCAGAVCDYTGTGTQDMAVTVGDDDPALALQVGMAPNATWIACKGCESRNCSEYALNACFDWILAPGGDPANRPQVVSTPWRGPACDPLFRPQFQAWRAAGILPVAPIGSGGPGCGSAQSPGDYPETFAVAAHDAGRVSASFSGRGPSCYGEAPYTKPNISAPGVNICSASLPDNWSCAYNGTGAATPYAAGAVALLWSCAPALVGQVTTTLEILQDDSAAPPAGPCGAPPGDAGNYTYGYGYLDVYQAGLAWCGGHGVLAGHVRDSTAAPLPAATVQAARRDGFTYQAMTDASGAYTLPLRVDTYTVTAFHYGFLPQGVGGIVVSTGTVVVQDLTLAPAPFYTVSGVVADELAGWPLYAQVALRGSPVAPPSPYDRAWTDPRTGRYSVTLAGGITYTFDVAAWLPGYAPAQRPVGPLAAPRTEDFALGPDRDLCQGPGYHQAGLAYQADLETGDGGFTTTGTVSWTWGPPQSGPGQAHSGTKSWNTNGYGSNQEGYLVSPPIDLGSYAGQSIYLSWWQWLQTETGYDLASVEVSKDGGGSWEAVYGPVSGDVDLAWAYRYAVLDPSYVTGDLRVRFHLVTDGSVNYPGWYVDDVGVLPIPAPTVVYSQDFEADDGGYTPAGVTSWAWGAPGSGPGGAHSGVNAWATNLAGNYGHNEDGFVVSPDIDLGAYAGQTLFPSWWQWLQTEAGCDFAGVEASRDGGATWEEIYGPASGNVDPAWRQYTRALAPADAAPRLQLRFHLASDNSLSYPGFYLDDVALAVAPVDVRPCVPLPGGLVVGNVYDANTYGGLNGAAVAAGSVLTRTAATPADPAVADGFYTLFLPSGAHTVTATMAGGYGPATVTVTVAASDTVAQDLFLPAGRLSILPAGLAITLAPGLSTTLPLTLANSGGLPAGWMLDEAPPPDVPWLGADPVAGTVSPAGSTPLAVHFDAGAVAVTHTTQFTAALLLAHDTPYAPLRVPVTMTVVVPCTPTTVAGFTWAPLTPTVAQPIAFTATADGSPTPAYAWDFGDGRMASGPRPTHTYAVAGAYTVTLTTTNPCGRQTVRHVLVAAGWNCYLAQVFSRFPGPPGAAGAAARLFFQGENRCPSSTRGSVYTPN